MKIKGVIKNLKIKNKIQSNNIKIYLGISQLLRAVWGQFSFRQFRVLAYISSQGVQAPSNIVSANYRALICCTCHFQSSSFFVYFGFLCLQVSSVPKFHHDTRGQRRSLIEAHLFSRAVGREEHCKQTSLACVGSAHSFWATLGVPPLTACVLSRSTLLGPQVTLQGNCLKQVLHCIHFPGLSPSAQILGYSPKAQTQLGTRFVPFQVLSSSSDQVSHLSAFSQLGGASYHLPCPRHLVSWVHIGSTISGALCVSSGELISDCDPPGRCQPSRIPGRLHQ